MSDLQHLNAGAVLEGKPELEDVAIDALEARGYGHPGLAAPLIRLCPEGVTLGVDLEMQMLGFEAPEQAPKVGYVRRQKLGFPGWCLVNDPDNAEYALGVMKRLKQVVGRLEKKPGSAKESMDHMGRSLAGSVPHFLPSFYEACARCFLDAQSPRYAEQYFEKARAAEREYGLEVDPELREQTFVDFALAGALSVKSLGNLAKELAAKGKEGLESYLRISIRRTLGGLPPSPAALKDLRALSKAAGDNPHDTIARFFREILESPALRRVEISFFEKAKKSISILAKEPEIRGRLLDVEPNVPRKWLGLLRDWGCLDALLNADLEGQSSRPAAQWFSDALSKGVYPELAELYLKAQPRIEAEGVPLVLRQGYVSDVAVVEFGLEHGLTSEPVQRMNLRRYLDSDVSPDLPKLAAEPSLRTMLVAGVKGVRKLERCIELAGTRPHFRNVVAEALTELAGADGSLADLSTGLERLETLDGAAWQLFPELGERLGAVDVSKAAAKTLRIGHPAEWRWPLLDAVVEELGKTVKVKDQGDHFLAFGFDRVVVMSNEGERVAELRPQLNKGEKIFDAVWCEGDALLLTGNWRAEAVWWAKEPSLRERSGYWESFPVVHCDDAGRCVLGDVPLRPGLLPAKANELLFDGEHFYRFHNGAARIYDPFARKTGPERTAAFFEGDEDATKRWPPRGVLRYVPAPVKGRAIRGVSQGAGSLYGHRRPKRGAQGPAEDIAGGRCDTHGHWSSDAFYVPGSDALRIGQRDYRNRRQVFGRHWEVRGPDGLGSTTAAPFNRGLRAIPSWSLWRHLEVADAAFSEALRNCSAEALVPLIAFASEPERRKVEAGGSGWTPDATILEKVTEVFGEGDDETIRWWVAGIVHHAGVLQHRLQQIRAMSEATQHLAVSRSRETSFALENLGLFRQRLRRKDHQEPESEMAQLRAGLDASDQRDDFVDATFDLWPLFGFASSVLYRGLSCPEEERAVAEKLARALVESRFEEEAKAGRIRWKRTSTAPTEGSGNDQGQIHWLRREARQLLFWRARRSYSEWMWEVLEFCSAGGFQSVAPEENGCGPGGLSLERLEAFLALAESNGPLPIDAAAEIVSAEVGLSPLEAKLWLSVDFQGRTTKGLSAKGNAVTSAVAFLRSQLQLSSFGLPALAREVAAELMAGDPAELWQAERLAQRGIDAWVARFPKVPSLGAEHDQSADLGSATGELGALARLALPGAEVVRSSVKSDQERWFNPAGYQSQGFGFRGADPYLRDLVHRTWTEPFDAPLFCAIPTIWAAVRERLDAPTFFVELGTLLWTVRDDGARQERIALFGDRLPEHLWRGLWSPGAAVGDGDFLVTPNRGAKVYARPKAFFDNEEDPRVAGLFSSGNRQRQILEMVLDERGDAFIDFATRFAGKSGIGADPRISAPDAVARVGERWGLDENAAALYLMLAALPKPMDRDVRRFMGTTKKEHEAAGKSLCDAGLVIEGKRAGSGRKLFLPGLWQKTQKQEQWKAPFFGRGDARDAAYLRCPVSMPLPPDLLYAKVAERLETDPPKFEEPPKAR